MKSRAGTHDPQQHQPEQSAMRNEVNLTALKLNAQGEGRV